MNFIPKDLRDLLDEYKRIYKKALVIMSNASDLNFSGVIENKKLCVCENINNCTKNCPYGGYFELDLSEIAFKENLTFFLMIKDFHVKFNKPSGVFKIVLSKQYKNDDNIFKYQDEDVLLYTGIFDDFCFKHVSNTISNIIKINLPIKIILKFMYWENQNETVVINDGVINVGLCLNV